MSARFGEIQREATYGVFSEVEFLTEENVTPTGIYRCCLRTVYDEHTLNRSTINRCNGL